MSYYYAVANGRNTGVYNNWDDCKDQVHQYSGSSFKKFESRAEAERYVETGNYSSSSGRSNYPSSSGGGSSQYHGSRGSQEDGFRRDDRGYVDVYTDGACPSNGRDGAKAGIGVYFDDDSPYNVSAPARGRQTSNNAEIRAATEAAKQAQRAGVDKLRINTDSEFLVKCNNEWMPKWKANDWKTASGSPVVNKQELMEMDKAFKPLNVELKHVPGHKGIHGNERADELARQGSKRH